jgi:hypothetical protein
MKIELSPGDKLIITLKGHEGEVHVSRDALHRDSRLRIVGGEVSYFSPQEPSEYGLSWGSFFMAMEPKKPWRSPSKPATPAFGAGAEDEN